MHQTLFLSSLSVGLLASTMIGVNLLVLTQDLMIFCMLIISSHGSRTGLLQTYVTSSEDCNLILIYIIPGQGYMLMGYHEDEFLQLSFPFYHSLSRLLKSICPTTLPMDHPHPLCHCLDVQTILTMISLLRIYN
jgi:hypothetical protein